VGKSRAETQNPRTIDSEPDRVFWQSDKTCNPGPVGVGIPCGTDYCGDRIGIGRIGETIFHNEFP
jgi:hypothetical protein